MNIYIDGADNVGWHVDVERQHLCDALGRIGAHETADCVKADIVHNIWWDHFIMNRTRLERIILFFKKNVLVTASNFVDLDNPHYDRRKAFNAVKKTVYAWIAPSLKQKSIFDAHNIKCFYQPFYLDLTLFKPLRDSIRRDDLAHELGIPDNVYKDKVVIGSFQRDSEGNDLMQPKWQKDPELLIDLLKDLPKDKFVLLLAGPRRHYVISQCKALGIPYWYIGHETTQDDVLDNALSINVMPKLYSFIDLYLVTSRSEGGPKAVMESTATKTPVLSTDVGLAADFLDPSNVFTNSDDYRKAIHDFVTRDDIRSDQSRVEEQYRMCKNILGREAMERRLKDIYLSVSKKRK